MTFSLVKSLDNVKYYGYIPVPMKAHEDAFEEWSLDEEDVDLLNDDFVDNVNDACGTLLDYGDADYFDADKCVKLKEWLLSRLDAKCDGRLEELYRKLLEYADRAIALGTGVVVEL